MRLVIRLVGIVVVALLGSDVAAGERYEGWWAAQPTWCKNVRRIGDEIPIVIAARSTSASGKTRRRVAAVGRAAPGGSYLEVHLYEFCELEKWQQPLVAALARKGLPAFHGRRWMKTAPPFDLMLLKRSEAPINPASPVFLGPLDGMEAGVGRRLEAALKDASKGQLETIPTEKFDLTEGGLVDCFEVTAYHVPEVTSGMIDGIASGALRVRPGQGVGTVGFGDDRAKVLSLFGPPLATYGTNTAVSDAGVGVSFGAGRRSDEWASEYGSIEVQYLGDRVQRLTVTDTPRLETAGGLSTREDASKFRAAFPKSEKRCSQSGGSGDESTTTRYTDRPSGIAFEVDEHGSGWTQKSLVVFPAGDEDVGAQGMAPCE